MLLIILVHCISSRPDFSAAWMNLGIVQAALHKYTESESSYLTGIKHRRKYPDCYYNLGNLVSMAVQSYPIRLG